VFAAEHDEVVAFFSRSTRNLLEAERKTGVQHHVLLSIVGLERFFGLDMAGDVLLPGPGARIAPTTFEDGSPARPVRDVRSTPTHFVMKWRRRDSTRLDRGRRWCRRRCACPRTPMIQAESRRGSGDALAAASRCCSRRTT
jgi:hypothetical protein